MSNTNFNVTLDPSTMVRELSPAGSRTLIAQSGVAVIAPAAGTFGNNGALSALPVAMPKIYANAWIFLQAGKIYAGSAAGIYFVKMSSTTAGTVYNITLPVGKAPYVPTLIEQASNTFVCTGAGAFTGNVATDVFISIPVPGGLLGANGALFITANFSGNGAGNPTASVGFGAAGDAATELHKLALGTNLELNYDVAYRNQGVETSQYTTSLTSQEGTGIVAAAGQYPTVDTAATQYVNLGMFIGSTAGGVQLEGFTIEAIRN